VGRNSLQEQRTHDVGREELAHLVLGRPPGQARGEADELQVRIDENDVLLERGG
jgi:hypothetical protein